MIEKTDYETYMQSFGGADLGHHRRYLLGVARYVASVDGRVGSSLLNRLDAVLPEPEFEERDDDLYAYLDDFRW